MWSLRLILAVVITSTLALGTRASLAADQSAPPHRLMSYDEAKSLGLPVPVIVPDLPICPDVVSDGFRTPEEMEAAVDDNAKATCQADPRKGVIRVGTPLRSPSTLRSEARVADTGYHFVGPSGTNYVRHGVRSGFEAKNPDVTHGSSAEFVAARSLAQESGTSYWVEAGWGEFWDQPDKPIAYACFVATCVDFPDSFPLTVGNYYPFRAHHCGFPGQNRVCGEIWYDGQWMTLGTWLTMRCTNSDNSGNCRVENLVEVYSVDSTPHPSFGGGGITAQNGMLKTTPTTFSLWTTAYGTPTVYATSPYVISWTTQWHTFKACKDAC